MSNPIQTQPHDRLRLINTGRFADPPVASARGPRPITPLVGVCLL